MRQMIITLVCLLFACNVLSQNVQFDWIGDTTGGDWDTATKWTPASGTDTTPSKTNSIANFPNNDNAAGPITLKTAKNIYGITYAIPYDTTATPPLLGTLTVSSNLTAHDITIDNGRIVNDKGFYFLPYNTTSTLTVDGGQLDAWGWVLIPVVATSGVVNIYGHIDTVTANYGSGITINVWGSVGSIRGGTTINVYSGAVVTTVDPYGADLNIWSGSKIDTIAATYSSANIYFKPVNKTDNTVDVQTIRNDYGGSLYLKPDNGTVVNVHKWSNTTVGYTYIIGGDQTAFNYLAGASVYWNNVYVQGSIVVTNYAELWIESKGSVSLEDQTQTINVGTLYPEGTINIALYTIFHNKGVVSSTNSDSDSYAYSCYFYGDQTYDNPTDNYYYPTMTNDGQINCWHVKFSDIHVTNNGNVSSEYMELGGYSSGSQYNQPTFTYTSAASNEQTINLNGDSGQIAFEGDHDVWSIIVNSNTYFGLVINGNTTIRNFNSSFSSYFYISTAPTVWLQFSEYFEIYGRLYYSQAVVSYNGNYVIHGTSTNDHNIDNNSTVTFGENSRVGTTNSGYFTFSLTGNSALNFDGQVGDIYSFSLTSDSSAATFGKNSLITTSSSTYFTAQTGSSLTLNGAIQDFSSLSFSLADSTVTLGESSYITSDSNSVSFDLNGNSYLYLQGLIEGVSSVSISVNDATDYAFNQGIIDAPQVSVSSYYYNSEGPKAGYFVNVGTIKTNYFSLSYTNYGNCGSSFLTIYGTDSTYWNGRITYSDRFTMSGILRIEYPDDFDTNTFDDGTYPYLISYNSDHPPEQWDQLDEKIQGKKDSDLIFPILPNLKLCKVDSNGYVYIYDSAPANGAKTCDSSPVVTSPLNTVCAEIPKLPDATDPSGGHITPAGGPVPPGVTPGTPSPTVAPGPVTPGAPVTPGPVTPVTPGPVTPGPVTPGKPTPTTPGTKPPGTPTDAPTAPSSASGLSLSVVVSLFLSFYLFRMF